MQPDCAMKTPMRMIAINGLRWSARILSLAVIGVLLLFVFGEGFNPLHLSLRDWVLFLFFPFGLCLGMVVAWRWEGLGGTITVGSLASFYVAHRLLSPGFPRGVAFLAISTPGFLFLLCWLLTRSRARQPDG